MGDWLRFRLTHTSLDGSPAEGDEWRTLKLDGALERVGTAGAPGGPAILLNTGWYDRLLPQVVAQYGRLAERGCRVAITIGPWTHLGCQGASIAQNLGWLEENLAGKKQPTETTAREAPVRVYVTGADEWKNLERWPPRAASSCELFLGGKKKLSAVAPEEDVSTPGLAESVFTFDPLNPTPSIATADLFDNGTTRPSDAALAARNDVVTFTTAPLEDDLDVIGRPELLLFHGTDNPYADLWVLISEVDDRTGVSNSITERFLRLGGGEECFVRPEDASHPLRITLHDCAHRFRKGNRIQLLFAGGSHPRYIRNLGTAENQGTGTTMRPAVHTVRHGKRQSSKLVFPLGIGGDEVVSGGVRRSQESQ